MSIENYKKPSLQALKSFQSLFELCSGAAFIIQSDSGKIEACNTAAADMFGYSSNDLVNQSVEMFHADAENFDRLSTELQHLRSGRGIATILSPLRRRDGSRFSAQQHVMLLGGGGEEPLALYLVDEQREPAAAQRRNDPAAGIMAAIRGAGGEEQGWRLLLKHVGVHFNWDYAEVWLPRDENMLALGASWSCRETTATHRLGEESRTMTFARGEGLPGRAWERGSPEWLDDVRNSPRKILRRGFMVKATGLHCVFVLPVYRGSRFVGVFMFGGMQARARDENLVSSMRHTCTQLACAVGDAAPDAHPRWNDASFRELLHIHPLPLWVCSADDIQVLAANRAALALMNREYSDVAGQPFTALIGPDNADSVYGRLSTIDDRARTIGDVPVICADGSVSPVRLRAWRVSWERIDSIALMGLDAHSVDQLFGSNGQEPAEISRRLNSLTRREKDVLDRVLAGETNKSTADVLGISPRTVEVYRASMLRKMGARSTTHLWSILAFES